MTLKGPTTVKERNYDKEPTYAQKGNLCFMQEERHERDRKCILSRVVGIIEETS